MNEEEIKIEILNYLAKVSNVTINDLILYLKKGYNVDKENSLNLINQLKNDKKVMVKQALMTGYPVLDQNMWIVYVFTLSIVISVMVLINIQSIFVLIVLKYIVGTFYLFYIPGYTLMKVISYSQELSDVEKIGLSLGFSLVLTPLTGLVLIYTPFKLTLLTITVSLFMEVVLFSLFALYRSSKAVSNSYLLRN